jgi:hypothetical protein
VCSVVCSGVCSGVCSIVCSITCSVVCSGVCSKVCSITCSVVCSRVCSIICSITCSVGCVILLNVSEWVNGKYYIHYLFTFLVSMFRISNSLRSSFTVISIDMICIGIYRYLSISIDIYRSIFIDNVILQYSWY